MSTIKTYEATVYDPVFYSSTEGHQIQTNARISATALMHAIGYTYIPDFGKPYMLLGEDTKKPNYSYLKQLPFFVTDMNPVDVNVDEYTFRTTNYPEATITTRDTDLSKKLLNTSKGFPYIKGVSKSSWHAMRRYVGISPMSTYTFTVWDKNNSLPNDMRFKVGIKKTGLVKATRVDTKADSVTLNKFLLSSVYNVSKDDIQKLVLNCDTYERKNDPRLHHLVNVDIDEATNIINEYIM